MSADKLQEAIALIQAGDKKSGQNLLVDIVNADPRMRLPGCGWHLSFPKRNVSFASKKR